MAKVTAAAKQIASEFDHYLGYLERCLAELEEIDRSWGELPDQDKVDFLTEWSLFNVKLDEFRELIRRNGVPAEHHERYRSLQARIERNRSLVDFLWQRS